MTQSANHKKSSLGDFIKRRPQKRSEVAAPSDDTLRLEKRRSEPERRLSEVSQAQETPEIVARVSVVHGSNPKSTPCTNPKSDPNPDRANLPADYEQVLQALTEANPDDIDPYLGQGEQITDRSRFLETHLEALRKLRPESHVFRSYYDRARIVVNRMKRDKKNISSE